MVDWFAEKLKKSNELYVFYLIKSIVKSMDLFLFKDEEYEDKNE